MPGSKKSLTGRKSSAASHQINGDDWHRPPDPDKKAVSLTSDCAHNALVLDLLKNLHKDSYSEDEAELQFLYSKPSCFLILGKPGVGKTALARQFAAEWKCLIINSTDIILENMEHQTEIGLKCVEILNRGEAVPDDMVLKMIEDKINSPEVAHHGYVMDDFPCLSEELLSIQDQLELIKSWKLKPDFVINLRIPEKDIERRRLDQKVDPITGVIYTKDQYAPDKFIPPLAANPEKPDTGSEKEYKNEDEESGEEEHAIDADNQEIELPAEVVQRLVKRCEDMPQQVEANLAKYRINILRTLEDYMGDHDQQYLVELNGNLPVTVLFKQLMQKLLTFALSPAAVVTRLANDDDDDDLSEDMDTDDIMRILAPRKMVAPCYRWRRSKWLRNCPVALYEGNIVPGKPEFAVSFLDKIYCLSSAEALNKFMRNPRPYLVPKMPRTPCKIAVLGQPFSGKTTLCYMLANYYNGKVFDIHELARQRKIEDKIKQVEKVRIESTEKAIKQVKDRIRAIRQAEALKKEKERKERLLAEAEAVHIEQERLTNYEAEDDDMWQGINSTKESTETGPSSEEALKADEEGKTPKDEGNKPDIDDKGEDDHDKEGQEAVEQVSPVEGAEKVEKRGTLKDVGKTSEAGSKEKLPPGSKDDEAVIEIIEPEVDETHPEVKAMVSIAVSLAEVSPIQITPEFLAELLETTILEWEKELRNTRHDGPLHGCWILDNFPETQENWNACVERNLFPDAVYVLGDDTKSTDTDMIKSLCARYCLKNKDLIYAEINRKAREIDLKNQEAKIEADHKKIIDDEKLTRELEEELERKILLEAEAKAVEAARRETLEGFDPDLTTADTFPIDYESGMATPIQVASTVLDEDEESYLPEESETEIIEKTELEMLMEQPEAKAFIERLQNCERYMSNLLAAITQTSSIVPFRIAFEGYTLELVFNTVIRNEEKTFKYIAWEMGQVDLDEIEEDLEAAALEAVDNGENKEDVEEEEEDQNRSLKRPLGESNYFDPVSLKEACVLFPGNPEVAAMYRERMYYFSSSENKDMFIEDPSEFLSLEAPLKAPPLRLLMLGPRGAGKSLNSSYLSEKLGIFHISFRERLQELIISKTKRKIGPEYDDDEISGIDDSESLGESSGGKIDESETRGLKDEGVKSTLPSLYVSFDGRTPKSFSKPGEADYTPEEEEEVMLTDDEEAIKAYLESNEPLPSELLDSILKPFWTQEPFKSTGFILEGFPRTSEEARYLEESGLFPDAAILLQASENDIIGRLLPPKLDIWKEKRARRIARRNNHKAKIQAKKNAAIAKRREELLKEQAARRISRKSVQKEVAKDNVDYKEENEEEDDEEAEDEDEEDVAEEAEEDIEAILAEEFEDEEEAAEEEESEELEEDAVERMKNEFLDIITDDNDRISGTLEALEEIQIPCLEITAGRKPHIVRYIINKKIKPFVDHRDSLFERVYPISEQLADRMLKIGYKRPSRFGRWDLVQLKDGNCIQPMSGPDHPTFACIYRSYIYFLSSQHNRLTFMQDPVMYLNQESPKPVVPLRIAIIGPPKSGKTTLANRFVEDYGVVRLSIGEAMRQVLTQHPKCELAQQITWNLVRDRLARR